MPAPAGAPALAAPAPIVTVTGLVGTFIVPVRYCPAPPPPPLSVFPPDPPPATQTYSTPRSPPVLFMKVPVLRKV
jgi:hypothetical protein